MPYRKVPDTEYITNLRKINLKISMLVHTFCAPPPAVQQYKPSSGAKKLYSTKMKIFFFHYSKTEVPKWQLLTYEKTDVW